MTTSRRSIAFVSMGHFPSGFRIGGIATLMAGWAQEFASSFDVHMLAVYDAVPKNVDEAFAAYGDRLVDCRKHAVGSLEEARIRLETVDVVSIHQEPQWLPWLPPASVMMHNAPPPAPDGSIGPWQDAGLTTSFAAASSVQACSQWLGDQIRAEMGVDPDVVPPFVSQEFFSSSRGAKRPHALFAGRLVTDKGALDAAAAAGEAGVPLLVTDTSIPGHTESQNIRDRLASMHHVSLIPAPASPRQMASLLAEASAVLMPSVGEPFGLVSIEAQASRTWTLAYLDGGLPETLGPAAVGIPVGDVDSLAGALRAAVRKPIVPDSARDWIRCRFSRRHSAAMLACSLGVTV